MTQAHKYIIMHKEKVRLCAAVCQPTQSFTPTGHTDSQIYEIAYGLQELFIAVNDISRPGGGHQSLKKISTVTICTCIH